MKKYTVTLVFAGNYSQYQEFMRKHFPRPFPSNFVYVSSYEKSLGYSDPLIMKVGTWYENDWATEAIARYEAMNREPASQKQN